MATRLLRIDGPDCVLELRLTEDNSATRLVLEVGNYRVATAVQLELEDVADVHGVLGDWLAGAPSPGELEDARHRRLVPSREARP
jgi:hypothetical protein